jgi:putative molybdopterin biosynthesis protein
MESTNNYSQEKVHLLRPDEVAEVLNISKSLAYKLLQQGQIPAVRFNKTVRVRQVDLDNYINKCLTGER